MTAYQGPDRDFGEHDDYAIGDVVWTHDATRCLVVDVRRQYSSPDMDYECESVDGRIRTYDASRLALVSRVGDLAEEEGTMGKRLSKGDIVRHRLTGVVATVVSDTYEYDQYGAKVYVRTESEAWTYAPYVDELDKVEAEEEGT